jgi:hypothetical protein
MILDATTTERVRTPASRDASSCPSHLEKEAQTMQDQDKKQHAMTSFALFGGLFGSPRQSREERVVSRPQDFRPFQRK